MNDLPDSRTTLRRYRDIRAERLLISVAAAIAPTTKTGAALEQLASLAPSWLLDFLAGRGGRAIGRMFKRTLIAALMLALGFVRVRNRFRRERAE